MELQIEAPAKDLEDLRQLLLRELGSKADLQEISSAGAGELREPILISIIVALGGPAITCGVVKIVKIWADHRKDASAAERAKFKLLVDAAGKEQPLTFDQVLALSEASK
jgi:hypothetical protein